ncbi:MAG TPA: alpha/beta hydrolase [Devosiaceae bacterium]|jgi:pimeloyl-ACP methyl ester carboxylesterase|nr:alpha/beta hydrolase [Devosiaceae bacterium]
MLLLSILRPIFALLSLVILVGAVWLLWEWYQGETIQSPDGRLLHTRDDWLLWLGLALTAWSFLGRFLWVPLLARSDTDPTRAERGNGNLIQVPSGSRLYVESTGAPDGPVLILTHGWGMDSTIWYYARRALSRQFRIVTWDLPGLGRSSGRISLESFAADLAALVASVGQPVLLVGHSIGGMTIQTLARTHPQLFGREVVGVVLLNTTYTNPLKTMILPRLAQALRPLLEGGFRLQIWLQPLFWVIAWQSYISGSTHMLNRLAFGPHVTRSQLGHTALLTTRNPPAAMARGNLAMFDWDATGVMSRVTVPVLVLGGDIDIVTKVEASKAIASSSPGALLEVVGSANHMGMLDEAPHYHRSIQDFASSVFLPDTSNDKPDNSVPPHPADLGNQVPPARQPGQ